MLFADIIVDISHEKVDRPFQYRIPETLEAIIKPGVRVQVPFGNGNKLILGYVIGLSQTTDYPIEKIKYVHAVVDEEQSIEGQLIETAAWMKHYYGGTMIQALKTVIPVKQKVKQLQKREIYLAAARDVASDAYAQCLRKHQTAKARLLQALLKEAVIPYELIIQKLHVSSATIKSLERDGLIRIEAVTALRNPVHMKTQNEETVTLSDEQQLIVNQIEQDMISENPGKYLIHGITGSGKTQVYLELAANTIAQGKQVIVLIPEIALTYQTVLRFYKRFGDRVSVMNSSLSQGEKFDQFERAKNGALDIMIGPRSALFVPFEKLGMIIIDEEHEGSYKSENMPRYHARETAEHIAAMHQAALVLGSATPSLNAYYRAKCGDYRLFEMTKRLTGGTLPAVHVVDLCEELKNGNRSIFSEKLRHLIKERLANKEQIILFINRRGYAGFVSCRSCGYVVKCPHCDVSLTEHKNATMVCHYCGYTIPKLKNCPSCGSKYVMGFKAGTQQIEEEVEKFFPEAKVLRMDGDTTKRKGDYEKILQSFANEEADILIGTQMIVKGHDFPKVTLVGVLAADLSLNSNDYRAGERTFQLLTQAAGRAGRGVRPGEVVIQTYQPDHYSIRHAATQDYQSFYEEEIYYRDWLLYPPVAHMLAVMIAGKEEAQIMEHADILVQSVKEQRKAEIEEKSLVVIGPAKAGVAKVNDIYRVVFMIKHREYEKLIQARDGVEQLFQKLQEKDEIIQYDFDPMNTL